MTHASLHTHTARKIPILFYFFRNCAVSFPISTLMYLWAIYIFPGSIHIFPCSRIGRPILEIYKISHRYLSVGPYNSVLEITVSFLGIPKWEPAIYIGFSPALHLQFMWEDSKERLPQWTMYWCYIDASWMPTLWKKVSGFPVPSRDVTYQTRPGGNN
jgi:hypothetical protein